MRRNEEATEYLISAVPNTSEDPPPHRDRGKRLEGRGALAVAVTSQKDVSSTRPSSTADCNWSAFASSIDASAQPQHALAFQVISSNTGNQHIKCQPSNGCFCSSSPSSSLKSTALFPTRAITCTSTSSVSRSTALWAVTFQYSSSALDHLAALDDARPAGQ